MNAILYMLHHHLTSLVNLFLKRLTRTDFLTVGEDGTIRGKQGLILNNTFQQKEDWSYFVREYVISDNNQLKCQQTEITTNN